MIHAFKQVRLTNNLLSGSGSALVYAGVPLVFKNETGQFVDSSKTGQFITTAQTGSFLSRGETGLFYPASNPNNYITAAQAGGVSAITVTGASLSGSVNFTGLNGINVSLSGQYVLISGGNTGTLVGKGETGQFVTTSMTGGFITAAQTGQFITTSQTGEFITSAMTGILGIWTGNQQSFSTVMYVGIDSTGIVFPSTFSAVPRTVLATIEVTGDVMYMVNVRARTVNGYTAIFSDTVQESGVTIHTFASL